MNTPNTTTIVGAAPVSSIPFEQRMKVVVVKAVNITVPSRQLAKACRCYTANCQCEEVLVLLYPEVRLPEVLTDEQCIARLHQWVVENGSTFVP